MRIKHKDIGLLQKNPKKFVQTLQEAGEPFIPFVPASALRLAIFEYHKRHDNLRKAHTYLDNICIGKKPNLFRPEVIETLHDRVDAYVDSYSSCGGRTSQVQYNLRGHIGGDHVVTGQVSRIDVGSSTPYYGWAFLTSPVDWKSELRMPIIQYCLSLALRCAVDEVAVGVYCFQTNHHELASYSQTQINTAIRELHRLLDIAQETL